MPIYTAANYEDCSIECSGSGNATYIEPDGPCITYCGEDAFANSVRELALSPGSWSTKFSTILNLDKQAALELTRVIAQSQENRIVPTAPIEVQSLAFMISNSLNESKYEFEFASLFENTTIEFVLIALAEELRGAKTLEE